MGRKDRNWLAGWLAASMGYVDKPLARVSWWCGWVSVSVSVAVFFILFSTKFYLNWKSVPTCAWHLIFDLPIGQTQCPPIHDTGFIPSLIKKPVPSCAWHLVFLLNNWASPVPTYTWHWLTLFEFFFKKKNRARLCMTLGIIIDCR